MQKDRIKRSKSDIESSLSEQYYFLMKSCQLFDNGDTFEAKRIALAIRILIHDTRSCHSIFSQMGLKERMIFLDTAERYNPRNLLTSACLVCMAITNMNGKIEQRVLPILNKNEANPIDFSSWWEQQIILDDKSSTFTRKDLILSITNTDGGAHIDPSLEAGYFALTRNDSMKWLVHANGQTTPIQDFCLASVRQIGYEMCKVIQGLEKNV